MVVRFEWRQTIDGDQVGFVDEPKINLLNFAMVFDCLVWLNHISEAARCKDFSFELVRSLEFLSSSSCQRIDFMVYFVEQSFSFRGYLYFLVC